MMEITITCMERIQILGILPYKSNMITLLILRDLKEKLQPTQLEIEAWGIEVLPVSEGKVFTKWDDEKETPVKKEFTRLELDEIKKAIKALDKKKDITDELLDMALRFRDMEYGS